MAVPTHAYQIRTLALLFQNSITNENEVITPNPLEEWGRRNGIFFGWRALKN